MLGSLGTLGPFTVSVLSTNTGTARRPSRDTLRLDRVKSRRDTRVLECLLSANCRRIPANYAVAYS